MAPQLHYKLVLALARVLFVNGQATEQTVVAAERLGRAIELRAKVDSSLRDKDASGPRWSRAW